MLNLKKNDFEIIGYARKSPSNVNPGTRLNLLQTAMHHHPQNLEKTFQSVNPFYVWAC